MGLSCVITTVYQIHRSYRGRRDSMSSLACFAWSIGAMASLPWISRCGATILTSRANDWTDIHTAAKTTINNEMIEKNLMEEVYQIQHTETYTKKLNCRYILNNLRQDAISHTISALFIFSIRGPCVHLNRNPPPISISCVEWCGRMTSITRSVFCNSETISE